MLPLQMVGTMAKTTAPCSSPASPAPARRGGPGHPENSLSRSTLRRAQCGAVPETMQRIRALRHIRRGHRRGHVRRARRGGRARPIFLDEDGEMNARCSDCCAAAGSPFRRRVAPKKCRATSAWWPPPTRTSLSRGRRKFARISTTNQCDRRHCRRCATVARTSRMLATLLPKYASRWEAWTRLSTRRSVLSAYDWPGNVRGSRTHERPWPRAARGAADPAAQACRSTERTAAAAPSA